MKKKIISLVLALLVCCSAAFLFAGCFGTIDHNSTLVVTNNPQVFTFEALVKKDDNGKVKNGKDTIDSVKDKINLTYTAHGDVYYARNSKGEMEEKEYKDFKGTCKKAEEDFKGKKEKVVDFNFTGLDLTTITKGNETRTLTIVINNATVKVKYKVVDPS